MARKDFLLLPLIAGLLLASCTKKPGQYPDEPGLALQSMTNDKVVLTDTSLGVRLNLSFTDGDGDIGLDPDELTSAIFLKDSRDTVNRPFTLEFPFPYIDPGMRPNEGGLEGYIAVNLGTQFFSISDSLHLALGKDTLTFDVYIVDTSGHKSNVVTTPPIYISID